MLVLTFQFFYFSWASGNFSFFQRFPPSVWRNWSPEPNFARMRLGLVWYSNRMMSKRPTLHSENKKFNLYYMFCIDFVLLFCQLLQGSPVKQTLHEKCGYCNIPYITCAQTCSLRVTRPQHWPLSYCNFWTAFIQNRNAAKFATYAENILLQKWL